MADPGLKIFKQALTIDYLVNNAADQSLDPEDPLDEKVMNSIMFTNVLAPQAIVKACLNIFKPGSAIVNITSIEAEHPFPNHSLYASSKAALTRYTELAPVTKATLLPNFLVILHFEFLLRKYLFS